ncbi:MAG TPA: aminoacyl-tRNA hydrolase [Mycobacteriales bacterium]|nr:aminoacyl-tRNA hydrolase [Mycobacteriales bacterium]
MGEHGWLVVGLGNAGPAHAGNRHNAGFMVADVLVGRTGSRWRGHKGRADVVEGRWGPDRVVVAKPRSYMNESGGPVAALRDYFQVPPDRMVVLHDELDIPFGALRVKLGGGDNGHNGLRSVRRSLGSGEFARVRFGIGRPPGRLDPATFVLRDFSPAERKELPLLLDRAADAVESLVANGLAATQNAYNAS